MFQNGPGEVVGGIITTHIPGSSLAKSLVSSLSSVDVLRLTLPQ